jgi:hypothetical protein
MTGLVARHKSSDIRPNSPNSGDLVRSSVLTIPELPRFSRLIAATHRSPRLSSLCLLTRGKSTHLGMLLESVRQIAGLIDERFYCFLLIIRDPTEERFSNARICQHALDLVWLPIDVLTQRAQSTSVRLPQPTTYNTLATPSISYPGGSVYLDCKTLLLNV